MATGDRTRTLIPETKMQTETYIISPVLAFVLKKSRRGRG
jgi:hypothetical protein